LWFGGKRRVADIVWPRFGDVPNYVEPFFGSGAMLLDRPHWSPDGFPGQAHTETVNDLDGSVVNFWRAIKHDPEQTARWADNPVYELDLHARHQWLHRRLLSTDGLSTAAIAKAKERGILPFSAWMEESPENYDCQVAGWWCWGVSSWIGAGWCRPTPQYGLPHIKLPYLGSAGMGVNKKLPHLKRPHLGNAGKGVNRKRPHLSRPMGCNQKISDSQTGDGVCANKTAALVQWFFMLKNRFRNVDICCGDWQRVLGFTPTEKRASPCGVFLDPPYSQDHGLDTVYGEYHDRDVAAKCRAWCIERGASKDLRICLCGYETEHAELHEQHGWEVVEWKAAGGYGSQRHDGTNDNAKRERLIFSPGCLPAVAAPTMFEEEEEA